jgi:hypothetical protein
MIKRHLGGKSGVSNLTGLKKKEGLNPSFFMSDE